MAISAIQGGSGTSPLAGPSTLWVHLMFPLSVSLLPTPHRALSCGTPYFSLKGAQSGTPQLNIAKEDALEKNEGYSLTQPPMDDML